MIPKEVFLSHSSKNRTVATRVSKTLSNHGISVWYSPKSIKTAAQWQDAIGAALNRCDWFVVLLSPASVGSKWVKWELAYALRHSQYDDHVLPILIKPCDFEKLSWTLGGFQMASLDGDSAKGYTDILGTWGVGFDPTKMAK